MTSKSLPIAANAVSDSGLPDFLQPPVDEVALSIQFPVIPRFNVAHFGLYWQQIRADFPRYEVRSPISNVVENVGTGARISRQLGIELLSTPEIRSWYIDQSGNRLLQIQHDRFVHNWRKISGTEHYPRYPKIRDDVAKEWSRFCDFLKTESLDYPKVNQCEVTYVNHIEYEKGWNGYGELDKVIATLVIPKSKGRFLPSPESIGMQVTYLLEENAGRLHVSVTPVIRARDGKEVLQLSLTARGAPKSSSEEDIFAWLDLGRKWVVRGFADFTTDSMHKNWGKQ